MANNLETREADKPSVIDLSQAHEVTYWTEALGVSEGELRDAVAAAGTDAAAVREYVKQSRAGGGGPNTAVDAAAAAELIPKPFTSRQE